MHYWLVIIPMTMKLCLRGMPTKTFNIHELQVCKQQQIASGNWRAGASQPSRPTGMIFIYVYIRR